MREPAPLPSTVNRRQLIDNILHRHEGDPALPGPDNLIALLRYVQREVHRLRSKEQRQAEVEDALYLTRFIRQEADQLELGLIRAGEREAMPNRALGRPLGITSRAGPRSRRAALEERVEAARLHITVAALRATRQQEKAAAVPESHTLREVAQQLIDHIALHDENRTSGVASSEDVRDSAEGINLTLRSRQHTERQDASIRAQLRTLVEEIEEAAARQGCAEASTDRARSALAAARAWFAQASARQGSK